MRYPVLAVAVLMLTACAKSDDQKLKAEIMRGCKDSGAPDSLCQCSISKIEEKYSSKQLSEFYRHQDRVPPEFVRDSLTAPIICANDPSKSLKDLESAPEVSQDVSETPEVQLAPGALQPPASQDQPQVQTPPQDQEVVTHDSEFGSASRETLDDIKKSYAEKDGILNQAYKAAMGRLDSSSKQQLREQQRAWLKERDQSCGSVDGQATDKAGVECLIAKADERAKVIEGLH